MILYSTTLRWVRRIIHKSSLPGEIGCMLVGEAAAETRASRGYRHCFVASLLLAYYRRNGSFQKGFTNGIHIACSVKFAVYLESMGLIRPKNISRELALGWTGSEEGFDVTRLCIHITQLKMTSLHLHWVSPGVSCLIFLYYALRSARWLGNTKNGRAVVGC